MSLPHLFSEFPPPQGDQTLATLSPHRLLVTLPHELSAHVVLLTPHLPSSLSLPYLYCFLLLLVLKEMVVLVTGLSPGERLLEVVKEVSLSCAGSLV